MAGKAIIAAINNYDSPHWFVEYDDGRGPDIAFESEELALEWLEKQFGLVL